MARYSVFSQICKIIPRAEFQRWVSKHEGDKGIRRLDCWTWFGSLLFSQLTGHDSIRALERVFAHGGREMRSLGFSPVCRSTLSDANSCRPLGILQNTYEYVLGKVQALPRKSIFAFPGKVLALDSTFIRLCLSLCPWAKSGGYSHKGHKEFAGIKMHTAIDLAGEVPEFICLRTGHEKINNDLKVAGENFRPTCGSTVTFDRGYWKLEYFKELNERGCFFVTRLAKRTLFRVTKSREVDRTQGLICDQDVYASGRYGKKKYGGKLRRIVYKDCATKKNFIFITNRFDLEAKDICDIYQARWRIEIFFKTLKQNLQVKKFLGLSEHAVKAQILVALTSYLLISYIKLVHRSSISMTEITAAIMTLLLLKMPLNAILKKFPRTKAHSPPIQLQFNF
jgi:putative transposase